MTITHPGKRYFAMILAVTIATLIRLVLLPAEAGLPFLTYYPALVIVAIVAGVGPGVAFIGLSAIAADYFFIPAFWDISFSYEGLIACGAYVMASSAMLALLTYYQRTVALQSARLHEELMRRTQAKEVARESERRLIFAQKAAKIGAFEWNIQTGHNIWTPELEAMYGLEPGEFGKTEPAWEQLVHPEDRAGAVAKVKDALSTGAPVEHEWRVVWRDGSVHWLSGRFQAYMDAAGNPLRLSGVNLDITERKAVEAQLRQTSEMLSEAQRIARFGSFGFNAKNENILWSEEESRIYGLDPAAPAPTYDELLAKCIHPDDAPLLHEVFTKAMQSQSVYELEHRVVHPDGSVRWVYNRAQPYFDDKGNLLRYIGATLDVTERKAADAQLAQASVMLSEAQRIAHLGSFEYDARTRTTIWSDEEYRIYGLDPTVPSPTYNEMLARYVHPDDAALLHEVFTKAMQTQSVYELEHRIVRPDGSVRWVYDRAQPYFDDKGNLLRYIGATLDITDRKQAEAALQSARDDAERANQAKSRFLAAASHDLRQPLSALSIYANSLKQYVVHDGQPMLSNLRDCVASLSELLCDLLDLSKLEAGVVNVNVQNFALDDITTPLTSAHAPEAILKGLQLRSRPASRIVNTDPVLLHRIVGNFLANAIRYTERGGVLMGFRRHAGKDWLEVWDTGIGIPEEQIPEVFEEFNQLDDDARTRGSGLGLAIVARTAKLLGLEVRVRSRLGKGSLFAIELPPGEAAPVVHVLEPQVSSQRPLCIALAEDNKAVRDALVLGLEDAGHRVYAAASCATLQKKLEDETPDIVVSDYRLKGETGFQVIATLRATYGDDLPAILITGDTDPVLVRNMADRGVAVLHKPVDLETLLAYMEEASRSALA